MAPVVLALSAAAFEQRARPLLLAHEAENSLLFSMLARARSGRLWGASFRIVLEDHEPVAAAVLPPDRRLVVSGTSEPAMATLAAALSQGSRPLTSVLGPPTAVAAFADAFNARTRTDATQGMRHVAYQTEAISPYDLPRGRLRRAEANDRKLVASWAAAFITDVGLRDAGDPQEWANTSIDEHRVYLWHTDHAVAMATHSGDSPNGARIGWVYTPPEERRRGFGAAVTAELARTFLATNRRYCFLYADANNAMTCRLYERLGFRVAGALEEQVFVRK